MNIFSYLLAWFRYRSSLIAPTTGSRVKRLRKLGAKIGENVFLAEHIISLNFLDVKLLEIEDNVSIGPLTTFVFSSYHDRASVLQGYREPIRAPIRIREGTYIGSNVTILPGVTIGKSCLIGAYTLVNRDIPDNSLAYGVPVRVIKNLKETGKGGEPEPKKPDEEVRK